MVAAPINPPQLITNRTLRWAENNTKRTLVGGFITPNAPLRWWGSGVDGGGGGVGWQPRLRQTKRGGEARGGEWVWGSNRSGDEECFWSWPEKFSGGGDVVAVVAGGWEGRPKIEEREE
ncbi:hypothetical protein Tco_1483942 [Tanacetum coccineum]